jgi:hypothetical protein
MTRTSTGWIELALMNMQGAECGNLKYPWLFNNHGGQNSPAHDELFRARLRRWRWADDYPCRVVGGKSGRRTAGVRATLLWTGINRFWALDRVGCGCTISAMKHWRSVGIRQSPLTGGPRPAVTPAHAILNYCFALLHAETRLAISTLGTDPRAGSGATHGRC